MYSLKRFFKRRVLMAFILFYTIMFMLVNIAFLISNQLYINHIVDEQNASLVEMLEHLIKETDEESALVFLEHYGHTHQVYLWYESDVSGRTLATSTRPQTYTVHELYAGDILYGTLQIDTQVSNLLTANTVFLIAFNGVLIVMFMLGVSVLMMYVRKQTRLIMNDMHAIKQHIRDEPFEEAYYFEELLTIDQAFTSKMAEIERLKNHHKKTIQRLTHDIKTPLMIIRSTLEAVEEKRLPLKQETIESMIEEVNHMDTLIPKLMISTEPEVHKSFDLSQWLHHYLDKVTPVFQQKGIEIIRVFPDSVTFVGPRSAYERIFDHIISNVLKHAQQATKMRVHITENPHTFIIEDNGVGPYTLLPGRQVGTGYGLGIVNDILTMLNGEMTIEEIHPQGIRVKISFSS